MEPEWKALDGWYERDQTAMSMSRLSAMRDGRLAYIARVRHSVNGDCEMKGKAKEGSSRYFYSEIAPIPCGERFAF